jgi:hypothetical protein
VHVRGESSRPGGTRSPVGPTARGPSFNFGCSPNLRNPLILGYPGRLLNDLGHQSRSRRSPSSAGTEAWSWATEGDRQHRAAETANDVREGACGDFSRAESPLGEAEGWSEKEVAIYGFGDPHLTAVPNLAPSRRPE